MTRVCIRQAFFFLSFSPDFMNLNVTQLLIGYTVWFSQSKVVLPLYASKYKKKKISGEQDKLSLEWLLNRPTNVIVRRIFDTFPHDKILHQTKLKAFADDKQNKNDQFCL